RGIPRASSTAHDRHRRSAAWAWVRYYLHPSFPCSSQYLRGHFERASWGEFFTLLWRGSGTVQISSQWQRRPFPLAGSSSRSGARLPHARASTGSGGVFEAEHLALVVVREGLRVAAPADTRPQGLLGRLLVHVVLELIQEAALRGRVAAALIEHPADVAGHGHVGQQVAIERLLALVGLFARELQ